MKLHLPNALRTALLACMPAAIAPIQAEFIPYSGTIYTYDGYNYSNDIVAFGRYIESTQAEDGSITLTDTVINGTTDTNDANYWTKTVAKIIASETPGDPNATPLTTGNTLRFTAANGTPGELEYTFSPLTLAGIIVEEGATNWRLTSKNTSTRNIYLGNGSDVAAFSTFHESFTLDNSSGNTNTLFSIRGTQTWDIDEGKTFTLTTVSGKSIIQTESTSIIGSGTASFSNSLSVSGAFSVGSGATAAVAQDLSLAEGATLDNSGTLNLGGAITLAQGASLTNSGTMTLGGNVTLAQGSSLSNSGPLNLGGAISLTDSLVNTEGGIITFAGDTVLDLSQLEAVNTGGRTYTYTISEGSGSTYLSSLTTSNLTGVDLLGRTWEFSDNGTISYTLISQDLIHSTGGAFIWKTGSAFDGGATFTQEDNVAFAASASVLLGESITVHDLSIDAEPRWA